MTVRERSVRLGPEEELHGVVVEGGVGEVAAVLVHGLGSAQGKGFLPELSHVLLQQAGVAVVLRVDLSGHGESRGRWSVAGYDDHAKEVSWALEWVNRMGRWKGLLLAGHSLGGNVVLLTAARVMLELPLWVINISGRLRMDRGIHEKLSPEEAEALRTKGQCTWNGRMITQKDVDERVALDMVASCSSIDPNRVRAVLTVHGEEDEVIPVEDAHGYDECMSSILDHTLITLPGADHGFRKDETAKSRLISVVIDWVRHNILVNQTSTKNAAVSSMLVLYGSETGNAQDVAERIGREGWARGFSVKVMALDEYDIRLLPLEPLVVFVVSTTGQGECPTNMKSFWKFLLRKSLSSDALKNVVFTVFGLGDSSYPIYNAAARRLYQRLLNLGATSFHPRGLGDDQHRDGYDGALDPWLSGMWSILEESFNVNSPKSDPGPMYEVAMIQESAPPFQMGSFGQGLNAYSPVMCRVVENLKMTPDDHSHDIRHVSFDIERSGISYVPGDVLILHPRNPEAAVCAFIQEYLKMDPDQVVRVKSNVSDAYRDQYLSLPISLRDLFVHHVDLLGVPKRYFFEVAARFAEVDLEKERLLEFASAEGREDLYSYCYKERRTHIEVLSEFPSVHIPLPQLLECIPRLRPRLFSISSSPHAHRDQIQITVSLLHITTPYKRRRMGLCSSFIAGIRRGDEIAIWTRKGSFTLPPSPLDVTLLLIGPGTGIAPFRSFCHEVDWLLHQPNSSKNGFRIVFFGNRNESKDYIYKDEWFSLLKSGAVSKMFTAFSRDQPEKIYVQQRLLEHGQRIWDMLQSSNTYVYLAGNSALPGDITKTLMTLAKTHGQFSESDAEKFVKALLHSGRFSVECWS